MVSASGWSIRLTDRLWICGPGWNVSYSIQVRGRSLWPISSTNIPSNNNVVHFEMRDKFQRDCSIMDGNSSVWAIVLLHLTSNKVYSWQLTQLDIVTSQGWLHLTAYNTCIYIPCSEFRRHLVSLCFHMIPVLKRQFSQWLSHDAWAGIAQSL